MKGNRPKVSLEEKIKRKGGMENYNFIWNVPSINQYAILKNGWYDLDIIDVVILYAIRDFIDSEKPDKIIDKNQRAWYWVCEKKILSDMPLLPIDSVSSVIKRIDKLIKYDLIERCPTNKATGKKFIALGKNISKLTYTNPNINNY